MLSRAVRPLAMRSTKLVSRSLFSGRARVRLLSSFTPATRAARWQGAMVAPWTRSVAQHRLATRMGTTRRWLCTKKPPKQMTKEEAERKALEAARVARIAAEEAAAAAGTWTKETVAANSVVVADAVVGAEQAVMSALHVHNTRTFRAVYLSVGVGTIVLIFAYWKDMINWLSGQTADVTAATLADHDVQVQVSGLAKTVVDEVLKDPVLLAQAKHFVITLLQSPDTQQAIQKLLKDTLGNEQTLKDVQALAKNVVMWLLADKQTLGQFVQLLKWSLADPVTNKAVADLAMWLLTQKSTQQAFVELLNAALVDPRFRDKVTQGLLVVCHNALNDEGLREHALAFLKDVLADESLRRSGGNALWSVVTNAITPSWGGGKQPKGGAPDDMPLENGKPSHEEELEVAAGVAADSSIAPVVPETNLRMVQTQQGAKLAPVAGATTDKAVAVQHA